jgi:hypothetical protein
MVDIIAICSAYKDPVYGFLSKDYWIEQDECSDMLVGFYDGIIDTGVFSFNPIGDLSLYNDEWTDSDKVDDTLDDLEDAELDATYIANWVDSTNTTFYTKLEKDDEDIIECVTRTAPFASLDEAPSRLIDAHWKPIRLAKGLYIWESPTQTSCEFIDMFKGFL